MYNFNNVMSSVATEDGIKGKELDAIYDSSKRYIDILVKSIDRKLSALEKSEASKGSFESSNWPYKEAFLLGQKHALNSILELISVTEVENV